MHCGDKDECSLCRFPLLAFLKKTYNSDFICEIDSSGGSNRPPRPGENDPSRLGRQFPAFHVCFPIISL